MWTIDRDDLTAILADGGPVRLVMATPATAFEAARIPGSEAVESLDEARTMLRPDERIVVYCTHEACYRSLRLAQSLARSGYRDVRRYAGGLSDWTAAGMPVAGSGRLGIADEALAA